MRYIHSIMKQQQIKAKCSILLKPQKISGAKCYEQKLGFWMLIEICKPDIIKVSFFAFKSIQIIKKGDIQFTTFLLSTMS